MWAGFSSDLSRAPHRYRPALGIRKTLGPLAMIRGQGNRTGTPVTVGSGAWEPLLVHRALGFAPPAPEAGRLPRDARV